VPLGTDRLRLTLGTKIEHNDYTGVEVQPSGRVAWTLTQRQMLWGAISRAVRTPSRIDRDFLFPLTPGSASFLLAGGPNFVSEDVRHTSSAIAANPRPAVIDPGNLLQRLRPHPEPGAARTPGAFPLVS